MKWYLIRTFRKGKTVVAVVDASSREDALEKLVPIVGVRNPDRAPGYILTSEHPDSVPDSRCFS